MARGISASIKYQELMNLSEMISAGKAAMQNVTLVVTNVSFNLHSNDVADPPYILQKLW
jgi:hypothetical protein